MTASSSEIYLMLISNLIFYSIRLRFYLLVEAFDYDSFLTKYSSFFMRFLRILRFSISVRLNFFSLSKLSSSSWSEFLKLSIWFWYYWCNLLICWSKVRSFLTDCPFRASMILLTSSFYLFHNIFNISALFFDTFATFVTI